MQLNGIFLDGSIAYRGCMSDADENVDFCLKNEKQCQRCSKRACNANLLEFEKKLSCIKCTPDENSNCNVVEDTTSATECAPTALGYKNRCYTHSVDGISYRDCLYEASTEIFEECSKQKSKKCSTCDEDGCNNTPINTNRFYYEDRDNESKLHPRNLSLR